MKPKVGFVIGRLRSTIYAIRGFRILIFSEHSFIFHGTIALILVILGFYNGLSNAEWGLQIIAIGLIMVAEALNTAIEKIADYVEPNRHKAIEVIKDVGAGAVLVAFIVEIVIVVLIYVPRIW